MDIANNWFYVLSSMPHRIKQTKTNRLIRSLQHVFRHQNLQRDITSLINDPIFIRDALMLTLAADEAFHPSLYKQSDKGSLCHEVISQLKLIQGATDYQLSFSDKHFGAVHHKSAICQSGVSLNSITHHIALIKPEINLKVIEREDGLVEKDVMNILILPWPLVIPRESFVAVTKQCMLEMEKDFGFFSYEPAEKIWPNDIISAIQKATQLMGDIDLVVLPECALQQQSAQALTLMLLEHSKKYQYRCPAFISGTYETGGKTYGRNQLTMFVPPDDENEKLVRVESDILTQNKHHRWYLDRPQIFNYKLGSILSPARKWWEYIDVGDRSLINYRCHKQSIQITPLICEDLARQDPVAPAVRALGPTLIIALLLDGAQLKNRWPGRYASFLSEDPGSSVLTVSPLGMTQRADGTGFPPSQTVAFWSEPGHYEELTLDPDKCGIVLTLEKKQLRQWTADGRCHDRVSLHYSGHICL
ncbi:hypothetical protein ABK905_14815 [Acerihabitans sp. KWT182]|uniref:CN hydrolase domain-containing protein n=1 Tax=Acerihabitans sp. KWT182 TaxID=3157919 RepID=A0AAU7Q5A2_9GAMM